MANPNVEKILKKTRDLFAATHWTTGEYFEYSECENKAYYCSIGGLRYIAVGEPDSSPAFLTRVDGYCDALVALAVAVNPGDAQDYVDDMGEYAAARINAIEHLEQIVVDWNDSQTTVEPIVKAFESALETV